MYVFLRFNKYKHNVNKKVIFYYDFKSGGNCQRNCINIIKSDIDFDLVYQYITINWIWIRVESVTGFIELIYI